ncbi:hypothetical protein AC578_7556 [Pseudocercospora eumusae]|uniref:Uncharacterized protein n=1 Tax=Pseudocercospora eumusae TaxID=321146 RepID=A0A139HRK3_9PEZI|nr:hypothetical protein AC578_7556 [Pseudocercospora eumusae]
MTLHFLTSTHAFGSTSCVPPDRVCSIFSGVAWNPCSGKHNRCAHGPVPQYCTLKMRQLADQATTESVCLARHNGGQAVSDYGHFFSVGLENAGSPLQQNLARDYINRTALGTELSPTIRAKVHRVADLMLDVHKTLVHMRYLEPEAIELGPHDINVTLCREHKIDRSIVYLWQILPYLVLSYAETSVFIFGGTLVDFRDEEHIVNSRDSK